MNKNKLKVWLPLLFSITMIAGIFLGYKMRDEIPGKGFFYIEKRRPIQEVLDLIENKYVDTVNFNTLADTAIQALLSKLDPHSVFIPAEELEQVNEQIAGSFFGIGIEFNIFRDSFHVINVLKDGPSFKAGIKSGDRFLRANGTVISGKKMSADSIRSILRGPAGTIIEVELLRGNRKMTVQIKRDMIPISSVDASYMMDSITGYIRLNKFSQNTYREFMENLEQLKKSGMQKLVFDLRGNGGGILDEAVEIADEFLDGDKLITYTIGQHYPKKEYRCRREGQFEKGTLVVLEDEGTASASEVLIGALQDWDRAIVVGRRSFGKGLVQDQFDLSDQSALRLTIARYYTPTGRSIQRPYLNGGKAYYDEITNRFTDGEVFSADSVKNDSTKTFRTAAGKKVFGAGGISPDYFVAADPGRISRLFSIIYQKGLLNDYGYRYCLSNPDINTRYPSAAEFSKSFHMNENSWQFFEGLAKEDSIDIRQINDREKSYLSNLLKASIAKQLWRSEGYYEVTNGEDNAIKFALELLRKK